MSRLLAINYLPNKIIEVVTLEGSLIGTTEVIQYPTLSSPTGFKGTNVLPDIRVGLTLDARPGSFNAELDFILVDGSSCVITYAAPNDFQGTIKVSSQIGKGPLRVTSRQNNGRREVTLRLDVTLNDQNQIVQFDPRNVSATLIYVFDVVYNIRGLRHLLRVTPSISSNTNNISDITALFVYNKTLLV